MKELRVFISYTSSDGEWSRHLVNSLRKLGVDPWFDKERLRPGADWASEIRRALESSEYVVSVLDPKEVTQPNIMFEAGMAVGLGRKVVFVAPAKAGSLPPDLKGSTYVHRKTPDQTAKQLIRSWGTERAQHKQLRKTPLNRALESTARKRLRVRRGSARGR
jgi:TIR domain